MHRRSRAEIERLVSEFEQSGLGRKEFSAAHGLSVHTLDAWRRAGGPVIRIGMSCKKLCPVHHSFIVMSGRVMQVRGYTMSIEKPVHARHGD